MFLFEGKRRTLYNYSWQIYYEETFNFCTNDYEIKSSRVDLLRASLLRINLDSEEHLGVLWCLSSKITPIMPIMGTLYLQKYFEGGNIPLIPLLGSPL